MPLFQRSFSVAAASVLENALAGSQWEFLQFAAAVQFGLVGDANASDLRVDVYSGADALAEDMEPSAANRMPIFPDDYTLNDVAVQSDRLKVRVRNLNAGAARTIFVGVKIDDIS